MSVVRRFLQEVLSDPLQVLTYDLGMAVDGVSLRAMARAWQKEYGRAFINDAVVHDAVHYLLDAPPTPMGEAIVTRFQFIHGLYDRTGFTLAVVGAGLLSHLYAGKIDPLIRKRRRRMKRRFAAILDAAS